MCHMSLITCHMSCVNCHLSPTPTVTDKDPPSANRPTVDNRPSAHLAGGLRIETAKIKKNKI